MIPTIVHESLFALAMLSLIWVLFTRKHDYALPLIVGAAFIFSYWNQARFPAQPTEAQYVVYHVMEAMVYLTSSLFLVRLAIRGAVEAGRVYFFLFVYDLLLLVEYYVVNVKGYWSAKYAYNNFELVGTTAIALITSFVLFGDWYNGFRRKRSMAVLDRADSESSVGDVNYDAKKEQKTTRY